MDNNALMCFKEFYNQLGTETDWSILVGNGLGLSHPNRSIQDIYDFKSFKVADVENIFKKLTEHTKNARDLIKSPEAFLDILHTEAELGIFDHYRKEDISKFICQDHKENLHSFLEKFKRGIFCLNYDHLLYQCILTNKNLFVDGFKGDAWISSGEIKNRLQSGHIPLYYLHGAYMLLWKGNTKKREYSKISAKGAQKKLHKAIEDKFKEIIHQYRRNHKTEENFLLVLAPKSSYKKIIIDENDYLKLCLKKLKESQKIFTFGCSFEKDEHLLEGIFTALSEIGKKQIRIGIYSDEDKEIIGNHLKKINPDTTQVDWKFIYTKNAGSDIWRPKISPALLE